MKTNCLLIFASALAAFGNSPEPIEGGRGPHHREWLRLSSETNELGEVVVRTNLAYLEMADCLHYQENGQGPWLESKEEFELINGAAVARKGQHSVLLLADIAEDSSVDLLTIDDKRFQSNPRFLSFYNAATKQNVLIAEVKSSIGQLIAPNVVLYDDCFDTIKGAIRFTYTRSGFEQDILLYENPGDPTDHGLDPATVLIEIYTEFSSAPQPRKSTRTVASGLPDETLDFDAMEIGRGKAFALLDQGLAEEVGVAKVWTTIEDIQYLVESAPYLEMKPLLERLPARQEANNQNQRQARAKVFKGREQLVAALRRAEKIPAQKNAGRIIQAALGKAAVAVTRPAVVIDYITLSTGQTTNRFQSDQTYFISDSVTLSGSTVFEPGTILKIAAGKKLQKSKGSELIFQGTDFRPITFTAKDDDSIGEVISGSSGDPSSTFYADPALYLDGDDMVSYSLAHLRINHAKLGLKLLGSTATAHTLEHLQMVHAQNGIQADGSFVAVRNALMYNVLTNFHNLSGSTARVEHLTVNNATWLNYNFGSSEFRLTNSLLIDVSNTNSYNGAGNFAGSGAATVFQTVGAGSHYLAANSPHRNVVETNITASLLTELTSRTTYPPMLLANGVTADTTLSPQAQRDTDTPDRGYHYSPLDWVAGGGGTVLTNATLILSNGVVLGTYGASTSYGIDIKSGGKLFSEGTATMLNRIVRYNTVQEQATTNWSSSTVAPAVTIGITGNPVPEARLRFTDWSVPGGSGYHFYLSVSGEQLDPVGFQHCQFGGGGFYAKRRTVGLTNCLWDRVLVTLDDAGRTSLIHAYNNLFRGGTLILKEEDYEGENSWQFYDNLFDQTAISQTTDLLAHDFNGYVTNANRLSPSPAANDKVLTNSPVFVTSTMGKYYYHTADGMLSLLIDAGSRKATNAGLYHFTTTTNKEAASQVDIGFHYVAVTNGVPVDSDSDGLPDYLEDRNNNGSVDSGETDWQNYNSLYGLTGSPGLQVFTPLK